MTGLPGSRDFHQPGRSPAYATHGMAATSMPAATLVALDMLRDGGSAMDAAVAAAAVLGVIEPQSTGIGGDLFCLYAPAGSGQVVALNGSGRAAQAASLDWYQARGITEIDPVGPHAVTIPGTVSAWDALLARFGHKSLDQVLQPAIRLAEEGWPVHQRVAADWAETEAKLRANGATHFLPGGAAPRPGTLFRQPALAATLRRIGREGPAAFYEGAVAAEMVAVLRARGGLQTEADFAAGRRAAEFVTPIRLPWRGYEVWECPPNGSGLMALMMLGILDGLETPPGGPLSALRLHRHIEAARLAYRDRDAFIADPAQAEVPVAHLLSPAYHAQLRGLIDDAAMLPNLPQPGEAMLPAHNHTVYLSVVDRDGNACSLINSIFDNFGSAIHCPVSGVLLHNRGSSFRLEAGHPNAIAPGKRPMHTIIPAMLTRNGAAVMPFGVMGGYFQPMGQSLLLTNMLEFGLDIQQALDLPRLLPRNGVVQVERGIGESLRAALVGRGHQLADLELPLGGGQAIWIDHHAGTLMGGSDPRKDGMALGY